MDISPAITAEPKSKIRQLLVRIALITALFLSIIILLDSIIQHRILRIFIESKWYFLFGSWLVFAFLLAVLLTEFHDMALPADRAWSNSEHIEFIGIYWICGFFMMPMLYFITMYSMIHDYGVAME